MLKTLLTCLMIFFYKTSGTNIYRCNTYGLCGCGLNQYEIQKIIGGELAPEYSWPWTVSFYQNKDFFCGGTVISEYWIMTAAHCFDGRNISQISIAAGSQDLYTFRYRYYVQLVIKHPNYNHRLLENDIALVKTTKPFNMSDGTIKRICLPRFSHEGFPAAHTNVSVKARNTLTKLCNCFVPGHSYRLGLSRSKSIVINQFTTSYNTDNKSS